MIFIVSLTAMVIGVFINLGIIYTTSQLTVEKNNLIGDKLPFAQLKVLFGERAYGRWLAVEALTIGFTVLAYGYLGWSFTFVAACFLIWTGILIGMVDMAHQVIPDEFSLVNAMAGVIYAGIVMLNNGELTLGPLISALIGGGFFYLLATFSSMGGGDVKYMAGACLFLSPSLTLLAIFITFMAGGLASLHFILFRGAKRETAIAFGPYLIIGICLSFIFGNEWIQMYLDWVQF